MTKYKIVLVPFPFDDLSSTKVRPAVCLTDPIGPHRHIVLAFITSRIPISPLSTDFIIDSSDRAFSLTGLRVREFRYKKKLFYPKGCCAQSPKVSPKGTRSAVLRALAQGASGVA